MTHDAATVNAPYGEPAGAAAPERLALWVGEWQVEAALNRIERAGQVVRLEPKAMAVLVYLAGRPMQVVGRDELLAAVWPGVIVGDNALTQVVIKLRKALGDTAREPAYVQAIAKKGYRLVAAVLHTAAPPASPDTPAEHSAPSPGRALLARQRLAVTRPIAVALGALLVVAAAIWIWQQRDAADFSTEGARLPDLSARTSLPTVQVKPFEVIGNDAGQALVARAINSDLATDLSKVAGLWVVGSAAPAQPPRAGEQLRPRYVLAGTVQQEGERLRLNVTLSDAEADRLIWSERFDRHTRDLFDVQDSLVKQILAVLPVKVSEAEKLRLAQRSTRNLEAYDQFIRGQAALQVRRPAQNEQARALFWDAIALDPGFARAYAGLAMTYALEYQQGWAKDGSAALSRAREFATSSMRMRPDMPEAHWVLAFVATQQREHESALRSLDTALRLNPSYADAYALQGGIHTYVGEPAKSLALLQLALRLNPDAGSLYLLLLGRAHYFLGDDEQARFQLERTLERNPENLEAHIYLAASLWRAGERGAAQWQVSEIRNLEPAFSTDTWFAAYPLSDAAEREQLRASMLALGL